MGQNGLELSPDGEDGSGQDVIGFLALTDFAAQAEGHVLAIAAPGKDKICFIEIGKANGFKMRYYYFKIAFTISYNRCFVDLFRTY